MLASIAYHWTRNQVVAGKREYLMTGLLVSGVLSILFLFGQLVPVLRHQPNPFLQLLFFPQRQFFRFHGL